MKRHLLGWCFLLQKYFVMLKITTPCSSFKFDNKLKRLHYYCLDSGITYDHCPVTRHV